MLPSVETQGAVRYERWSAEGTFAALSIGAGVHALSDRAVVIAQGEVGIPIGDAAAYRRAHTGVAWISSLNGHATTWSTRLGADWTNANAPRGIWPIAGGDLTRGVPLRAHPIYVADVLPTAQTSRAILSGGIAADRRIATIGPVGLAVGVFLDGADVMASSATSSVHFLDAGAGLRLSLGGMQLGAVRIDVARGMLADHRWGLSVGLEQHWPQRLHPFQ